MVPSNVRPPPLGVLIVKRSRSGLTCRSVTSDSTMSSPWASILPVHLPSLAANSTSQRVGLSVVSRVSFQLPARSASAARPGPGSPTSSSPASSAHDRPAIGSSFPVRNEGPRPSRGLLSLYQGRAVSQVLTGAGPHPRRDAPAGETSHPGPSPTRVRKNPIFLLHPGLNVFYLEGSLGARSSSHPLAQGCIRLTMASTT